MNLNILEPVKITISYILEYQPHEYMVNPGGTPTPYKGVNCGLSVPCYGGSRGYKVLPIYTRTLTIKQFKTISSRTDLATISKNSRVSSSAVDVSFKSCSIS